LTSYDTDFWLIPGESSRHTGELKIRVSRIKAFPKFSRRSDNPQEKKRLRPDLGSPSGIGEKRSVCDPLHSTDASPPPPPSSSTPPRFGGKSTAAGRAGGGLDDVAADAAHEVLVQGEDCRRGTRNDIRKKGPPRWPGLPRGSPKRTYPRRRVRPLGTYGSPSGFRRRWGGGAWGNYRAGCAVDLRFRIRTGR